MMSGKVMIPAADIWLMIGIIPRRIEDRVCSSNAWRIDAPSASCASMAGRRATTPSKNPSSPRLAALSTLPRTMPIKGMAYRGSYQGSGRMAVISASTTVAKLAVATTAIPIRWLPARCSRCSGRTGTSRAAAPIISTTISTVAAGDEERKTTRSTRPTSSS